MFFGFILIRIVFIACMVFIIGYVFGPFSKKVVLRRITRIAAILIVVLFFVFNVFMMRAVWGHGNTYGDRIDDRGWCGHFDNDSTAVY